MFSIARALRRPLRSRVTIGALAFLTVVAGVFVPGQPSQAAALPTAAGNAAAAALPNGFKSVGYTTSWSGNVNTIQYRKLTHINYAFVIPNANGTLAAVQNPSKLRSLVVQGHANNVKVLISIGGWMGGNDSPFESMASTAATRTAFVTNTINLVQRYNVDGVDIDWEYPNPGTSANNFTHLTNQLSSALHSRGKPLTAAVVSGGATALGVQPAVSGYVDFLNIMLYDGGSPHANYNWTISNINQWKSRGLPAKKAVLGVPFYSRPTYYSYARLVATDPANANRDCTTVNGAQQCYNGRPTIRRKTQWAMAHAGGMMNWELSQDSGTATSLVSTIYDTATGSRSGQITSTTGKCVDVYWVRTANGTPIQLWPCNGTNAQRWTVTGNGTIRALGKCLDVSAGSRANGAKVQLWDCNGTGAQVWQPQSNSTLRNPQSNKCLDSLNRSTAAGARLLIRDCNGGASQRWRLP